MKKIILSIVAILAIAMFIATKVNVSANMTKKNISFKNVEALAWGETPGGGPKCTGPKEGDCLCKNTAPCRDMSGCN